MKKTRKSAMVTVEIRKTFESTEDRPSWKCIVTTDRGRCYYAVYAGERPSEEKVQQDYLSERGTSRAKNWSPLYS